MLAFEGNNEPNNWGVTYQGENGGGHAPSWLAVAKLQRAFVLGSQGRSRPEEVPRLVDQRGRREADNVGLQFLTIPAGAGTLLPEGTRYADFANVHNYIYHPNSAGLEDNKTWNAADPTAACKVDGLYGNDGVTWAKHFRGYSETELLTLPRVTTETGCTIEGPITEEIQALNLLSMYLDQFKRGWSHTAVYILRDREDEGGNQRFGFFRPTTPASRPPCICTISRQSSLTEDHLANPADWLLDPGQPATLHEMLLQRSDGTFELAVWNERLKGDDDVTVSLGEVHPTLRVYDPTIGVEPIQTHRNANSLKLKLTNHPMIVAIAPG